MRGGLGWGVSSQGQRGSRLGRVKGGGQWVREGFWIDQRGWAGGEDRDRTLSLDGGRRVGGRGRTCGMRDRKSFGKKGRGQRGRGAGCLALGGR